MHDLSRLSFINVTMPFRYLCTQRAVAASAVGGPRSPDMGKRSNGAAGSRPFFCRPFTHPLALKAALSVACALYWT